MSDTTGIFPSGNRVVVKPDDVERKTAAGIIIPDTEADKHALSQTTGILVGVGPDAWRHVTEDIFRAIDGSFKHIERRVRGYSEPFAKIGDRVAYAKYSGLQVEGADGNIYRILNDEDITARVSDEVNFTDIKSRKPVGQTA